MHVVPHLIPRKEGRHILERTRFERPVLAPERGRLRHDLLVWRHDDLAEHWAAHCEDSRDPGPQFVAVGDALVGKAECIRQAAEIWVIHTRRWIRRDKTTLE